MSKLAWSTFIASHPDAHLVAGTVLDENQWWQPKQLLRLIASLTARLAPAADYALTIDRKSGVPAIHCAFAERGDADKLATAVGAQPDQSRSSWTFNLDDAAAAAIKSALASNGQIDQRLCR